MINSLISSIKTKLTNLYPTYNIYKEDTTQVAPAFFIGVKSSNFIKEFSNRNQLEIVFDLQCKINNANKNEQYWNIVMSLSEALEYLEVDGKKYKALQIKSEIIEGVLHYEFSIKTLLFKQTESVPNMKNIKSNSNLKE